MSTPRQRNPHQSAQQTARHETQLVKLQGGVVTNTPSDAANAYTVTVRPDGMERAVQCSIGNHANGDVYVPTEGENVVIGMRKRNPPIVLASEYVTDDSIESTTPGERRVSHPLSDTEVVFDDSGVLHVTSDDGTELTITNGEIHLDGDTQGVITDVQPTGTNSEGGITGLDITRSNTVKL